MGNVLAAGPTAVPSPPLVPPPPPTAGPATGVQPQQPQAPDQQTAPAEDTGPGTFEELHKKCKEVFPMPFEGAKLLVNKGLSGHFQVSHTLVMSSIQPSGYKFGATFVGTKQFSPTEAFPVLIGDIDASGNLNANIIHQFTKNIRCKFASQIQGSKWLATQLGVDYRGQDFTASITCANPDLLNDSGIYVGQYLQNVTSRLTLGAELLYQRGPNVQGNQMAIFTLAGRYNAKDWTFSSNITPAAGGVHACYYHKANENLQVGVELEGSLRTRECTGTIGYQIDLPNANLVFRGQVDSNWCIGAVLEKKLPPLPFTFALSAFGNHAKNAFRFGVGLIVGS